MKSDKEQSQDNQIPQFVTEPYIQKPTLILWIAAIASLLGGMGMGVTLGYTSPAFKTLNANSTDLPLTDDQTKAWIGSATTLAGLFGGVAGGPCGQAIGRRLSLIFIGAPFTLGWLLIAFANSFPMMIAGRAIIGFCAGLASGIAPLYCVEMATQNLRGLFGASFQVFVTIGILFSTALGFGCDWRTIAGLSIIPTAAMSILMVFMPESPNYLISKDRSEQALRVCKKQDSMLLNHSS